MRDQECEYSRESDRYPRMIEPIFFLPKNDWTWVLGKIVEVK